MSVEGKPKDRRKASKPIMEKRRRARINESLNELKTLILEAMRKDNSCYSKLEKADILEMTVQHLKNLKNQQVTGISSSNPASLANYRAGFNQCASEITRVVTGLGNTDSTLRTRLLEHLATRCLVTKPMDAADTRGQLSQASFPNQPILPKPPTSVTSPTSLSFIPQFQSSPGLLPATPYQLASYPMTNSKFAVLLPTLNPFMVDSSSATQPGLIPVFGKDPKEIVSPGVAPLGMDTRPFLWKPIP